MMAVNPLVSGVLAGAAVAAGWGAFVWIRRGLRAFLKYRGVRVVSCPENQESAAVEVDALRAAAAALRPRPALRLADCSRWPERRNCGQECLRQIEAAPEDCLVRNILTRWYEGKVCAICGKPFGPINWLEHRPALRTPEGRTVEWSQVPPEQAPEALASDAPVCWNCHIAETFRSRFPERVTDRSWRQ